MRICSFLILLSFSQILVLGQSAQGEDEFERPPISYRASTPVNEVSHLQEQLDQGEISLKFDTDKGYLQSVLDALEIPVSSQILVYSKTSLQARRISPRTPRAIYFNDDVYLGYCHAGDKLEITVMDPKLGAVFYTLGQAEVEKPHLLRQTDDCLTCHSSSRTDGVPGLLARSLFVNATGFPIFSGGSQNVDHTTPLQKRWGGWYVTGKHGTQQHQGNLIIRAQRVPREVDNSQGQNVVDLSDRFKVDNYLTPHSDIVSLMVLEHQLIVHNRMVKASYTTQQALDYEITMNRALNEPENQRRESTTRRIQNAGDALIEALLLRDEAELAGPIEGTSGFAEEFVSRGPRDSKGRSLRDFDLKRRLFKYPCSFLIYSSAFNKLPNEMKDYLWQELWEILANNKKAEEYAYLTPEDRTAIIEILRETKANDLPECWGIQKTAKAK